MAKKGSPTAGFRQADGASYSSKFMRRKENLSCFPLFLPAKNAAFQEAVLALMRVAEVCVSSPWFPTYHATPCGNLFLLPPVLSTQPAGFDFWGHISFLTARVADELAEARLKKGKTYRDLSWGAPAFRPESPSCET
jgi:hypothetical protein